MYSDPSKHDHNRLYGVPNLHKGSRNLVQYSINVHSAERNSRKTMTSMLPWSGLGNKSSQKVVGAATSQEKKQSDKTHSQQITSRRASILKNTPSQTMLLDLWSWSRGMVTHFPPRLATPAIEFRAICGKRKEQ